MDNDNQINNQAFVTIPKETLLSQVTEMRATGYGLSQICATKLDIFDILFSFEKEYELVNLRVRLAPEEELESVSGIYPCAYLYENEMKDLFGIKIKHMRVDFGGNLYKTTVKTPFNPSEKEGDDNGK